MARVSSVAVPPSLARLRRLRRLHSDAYHASTCSSASWMLLLCPVALGCTPSSSDVQGGRDVHGLHGKDWMPSNGPEEERCKPRHDLEDPSHEHPSPFPSDVCL